MKDNQRYNPRQHYGDRIIDEAADWFTRLQDTELGSEDREAFADWLSASPEHIREYLALTNLHIDISELPSTRSIGELIEVARRDHAENVVELRAGSAPQNPPPSAGLTPSPPGAEDSDSALATRLRPRRLLALAASVAIMALACIWWLYPNANATTYITSVGEQKSFALPDGSVVTLNAVSKVRIHYTSAYRDVELLSGEALFTVAKNREKPFRVLTHDSVIQAVGTQFNVYHRHRDTTVTVVEGTVEIMPVASQPPLENSSSPTLGEGSSSSPDLRPPSPSIRLTKGQRAHIDAPDAPIAVSAADAAVATAWRERRLTFESRPLGEVVGEFNLYNTSPIEIDDPALNTIQVSGSFNANDPQSFALFLEEAGLAKSRVESTKILLLPPTPH